MSEIRDLSLATYDASVYLDDEETIAEYPRATLDNPDPDAFLLAVCDVAKARGMTRFAADTDLGRENLYKAPKPRGPGRI